MSTMREKIIQYEQKLLLFNGYDIDIRLAYTILPSLQLHVKHNQMDLILLKASNFLNDIYRSYLCVCFPPNLIAASALLMSMLFLKIQTEEMTFSQQLLDKLNTNNTNLQNFPFKLLFDVEADEVLSLAKFCYQFLKIIK